LDLLLALFSFGLVRFWGQIHRLLNFFSIMGVEMISNLNEEKPFFWEAIIK